MLTCCSLPSASLAFPQIAAARCKPVRAESDLLGIRLVDEASTGRALTRWGLPAVSALASEQDKGPDGADADFPFVRLVSSDGRQHAKLFHHYGGVVGAFPEIEVRPEEPGKDEGARVPAAAFATERGIMLGLPERDLVRKLGSCFPPRARPAGESHACLRNLRSEPPSSSAPATQLLCPVCLQEAGFGGFASGSSPCRVA
jgi:hypothetical protein